MTLVSPVTNLFPNPSFEDPNDYLHAGGNLPGSPVSPTAVTIRTNYAYDPAANGINHATAAGQVYWQNTRSFGTGGAGTYTAISAATDGPLPALTSYARKQWTTAATNGSNTGFDLGPTGIQGFRVTPGDSWIASTWLRSNQTLSSSFMWVTYYDASGTVMSGVTGIFVSADTQQLVPGVWSRRWLTTTVPAGAAFASFITDVQATSWPVGSTLDGTGILLEHGTELKDYFDGYTPTTTFRTNLALNPNAETGVDLWIAEGGAVLTQETTAPLSGTASFQLTGGGDVSNSQSVVTAGQTITFSLLYQTLGTVAGSPRLSLKLGADAAVTANLPLTQTSPDRFSVTATASTTGAIVFAVYAPDAPGVIRFDDVLVEQAATALPYFDGSSQPLDGSSYSWQGTAGASTSLAGTTVPDFFYSWLSTASASASVQRAYEPNTISGGYNCWAIQSKAWHSAGKSSLRIIPNGASNDSRTHGIGGEGSLENGMQAGDTYTVLATFYQKAAQTGSLNANARSILVTYHTDAFYTESVQAQNIPGRQQLRLTFTLPPEADQAYIQLSNGASEGGGEVWWDDTLLVEGRYSGNYFDGDTATFDDIYYSWTGAQHYSPSLASPPLNTGLELTVFDGTNPTSKLDILARATNVAMLDEIPTGNGAGSFDILKNDPVFLDTPNLCDYRNVVKLSCNGKITHAFVIQNVSTTQQLTDQGTDYLSTYSGEGLRTWFNDAVLYPEAGLSSQSTDTRFFNFASRQGDWYDAARWTAPVINSAYRATAAVSLSQPWNSSPAAWPAQASSASWIWSTAFSQTTPVGDVYFRREFDTTADATSVVLYITSDNEYDAYIDSELISSVQDTLDTWHSTYTATAVLPAGHHVLGIKASNTGGPASILAALFNAPDPVTNVLGSLILKTGDSGWLCMGYPMFPPSWSVGSVLLQILQEAEDRGVLFPQYLTPTFTASLDSHGHLWQPATYEWLFNVGSTYAAVVAQIESMGYEVWIDPDTLELGVAAQRGVSRTDSIKISTGLNLVSSDGSAQADITNTMAVKSNDGWSETTSQSSIDKYGRIEGSSSVTGGLDQAAALASSLMTSRADPETGATYELIPTPGTTPNVDFFTGDTITALDVFTGEMVDRRVVSITTTSDEAGNPVYALEFDVIFQEISQRLAEQVTQMSSGAIVSPSSGTINPFGSGTAKVTTSSDAARPEQSGTFSTPSGGYSTVTFPAGLFSGTPTVLVQVVSSSGNVVAVPWFGAQPSSTGFSAAAFSISSPSAIAATLSYYAFQ